MSLVSVEDIKAAAERIDGLVVRTPLLECEQLSAELGCRLLIKPENLQHTGSFKPRGALNTMLSWRSEGRLGEVAVSFSAGNHAAAVAYAGQRLGVRAVVAMPREAISSKVANVRRYGGEIVPTEDLMATCSELAERYGCPPLYPFDLPEIIAGQGTAGLEICADEPAPDLVIVPVGGGGLIGGIATAVKALAPDCQVIGVESEVSNALGAALAAGEVVRLSSTPTIADGLAAPFAGNCTLAQAQAYVDDMVTVPERAIAEAWPAMVAATRLLLEPSAAVGLAALRTGVIDVPPGGTVVLVASGGNADLGKLSTAAAAG